MRTTRGAAAPAASLSAVLVLTEFLCLAFAASQRTLAYTFERLASGLTRPMYATQAPGDTDRLFIPEKDGVIKILDLNTGRINATPFLTIGDTDSDGEGGLQSMTFHPDFNVVGSGGFGKFYVHVTIDNGGVLIDGLNSPFSSHIREYSVSADPNVADPAPTEVISWVQRLMSHNGGWIGFSPNDKFLYVMSGDGGGPNVNNSQIIDNDLLGKALRIDVNGDDFLSDPDRNYAIPSTNPFSGPTPGDDEIWSYGLRNPWRASFDSQTGDLWIGDVGGGAREEIDFQPAASTGGENYAWPRREGSISHLGGASLPGDVEPVYDYTRGTGPLQGRSVIGGYVYHGPLTPLDGLYIFGDTITGRIWSLDPDDPAGTVQVMDDLFPRSDGQPFGLPVSFGEGADGNLFIVDWNDGSSVNGEIFRLGPDSSMPGDTNNDFHVDQADLIKLLSNFGMAGLTGASSDGDFNLDTLVGDDDLSVLLSAFENGTAAPEGLANVPEPAYVVVFGIAVAAALCRRTTAGAMRGQAGTEVVASRLDHPHGRYRPARSQEGKAALSGAGFELRAGSCVV